MAVVIELDDRTPVCPLRMQASTDGSADRMPVHTWSMMGMKGVVSGDTR